ncbi:sperm motility kinase 4A-like [Thomomys bottae]
MIKKRRQARSRQGLEASSLNKELLRAHYQVVKTIREGGFALVKLAKHLLTDTLVAVKVLNKRDCRFFATELELLKCVDHPNIIKLYEVVDTEEHLYLVMEYVDGGDLVDYLQKVDRLGEEAARLLFGQILRAVQYCHDHGIVHRDLKAENVLLDGRGAAKLCDFGLSARFSLGEQLTRGCGTMAYWAPEMFKQEGYQGPKVDVWSLGVLLYYMVMGEVPYDGKSWVVLRRQVLEGKVKLRKCFSPELRGILAYMMTVDPEKRPTVKQVMSHPWLQQTRRESPRPSQMTPDRPDPSILLVMSRYLGFDAGEVQAALSAKTFDSAMATYRILQEQQDKGRDLTSLVRQLLPGLQSCPSPAHPSCGRRVCLKRASAPPGHPDRLPAEQEEESGRRATLSLCVPCLFCSPCISGTEGTKGRKPCPAPTAEPAAEAGTPSFPKGQLSKVTCPAPEQDRQVGSRADSLPHILHNTWMRPPAGEKISSAAPGPATMKAEQEMEGPKPPPPARTETSEPSAQPTESKKNEQLGHWKRLKKNIIQCFQRLGCLSHSR